MHCSQLLARNWVQNRSNFMAVFSVHSVVSLLLVNGKGRDCPLFQISFQNSAAESDGPNIVNNSNSNSVHY